MIGCFLIQKQTTNDAVVKSILQSHLMFHSYKMIKDEEYFIWITWNAEREVIWQIALLMEYSNVMVGYGFGDDHINAIQSAKERISHRVILETIKK